MFSRLTLARTLPFKKVYADLNIFKPIINAKNFSSKVENFESKKENYLKEYFRLGFVGIGALGFSSLTVLSALFGCATFGRDDVLSFVFFYSSILFGEISYYSYSIFFEEIKNIKMIKDENLKK